MANLEARVFVCPTNVIKKSGPSDGAASFDFYEPDIYLRVARTAVAEIQRRVRTHRLPVDPLDNGDVTVFWTRRPPFTTDGSVGIEYSVWRGSIDNLSKRIF